MKRLRKISILVVGASLFGGVNALSQENLNALDYILQKRPGVDTIPGKKWTDNLFMNASVGMQGVVNESVHPDRNRFGLVASLSVGKWFNSVSAMRVGLVAGMPQHNRNDISRRYYFHGGLTLDYMYNLSNHLYGYNPGRLFTFMPFVGLSAELSALTRNEIDPVGSLRGGFQAAFRVSKGMKLFLEPSLSVYTDNFSHTDNWRGMDVVPTLMVGFSYDKVPYIYRGYVDPFNRDQGIFSNMFFTAGIGVNTLLSGSSFGSNFINKIGYSEFVGVGTWFTPSSGIRINLGGDVYRRNSDYLTMLSTQVDYLANLTSMFEGYDVERRFSLYGIAGANFVFPEKTANTSFSYGLGLGLQANIKLTNTLRFFLEPRVSIQSNKFAGGYTNSRFDLPGQLLMGLTYQRAEDGSYVRRPFEYQGAFDNYFVYASAGVNSIISGNIKSLRFRALQPIVNVGLGKWFNPISGARVYAQAGGITETQGTRTKLVGGGVDYLLNLTNLISGYDPGRKAEMRASIGGSLVYNTASPGSPSGYDGGLVMGLQGVLRVSPSIELFLEPKAGIYTSGLAAGYLPPLKGDVLASLQAGFIYRTGQYLKQANRELYNNAGGDAWFVSFAGGVGTSVVSSISNWSFGPSFELKFGKTYSPISAWRAGIRFSQFPVVPVGQVKNHTQYSGVDFDYLFDFTTFACGYDNKRLFSLHTVTGLSLGAKRQFSETKFIPGIYGGLQGRFRINNSLSLYVEPRADIYWRYYDRKNTSRAADLTTSALFGLLWKFDSRK